MNEKSTKNWLLRKRVLIPAFLILFLVLVVGFVYWYAVGQARQQIVDKLAAVNGGAVNGGAVNIGSVSLGTGGIKARDIQLSRSKGDPWVTADSMSIEAPLSELVGEKPNIDRIEIKGATIRLALDENGALPEFAAGDEPFSMPAKSLSIVNGRLEITQPGKTPLLINGLNATITDRQGEVSIEGVIDSLLGSHWQVAGKYQPTGNSVVLNASSEQFNLNSDEIAALPFVPDRALSALKFNGQVKADVSLKTLDDGSLNYSIKARPESVRFAVPSMNLDMEIIDGWVEFADLKLRAENLTANLGDGQFTTTANVDFTRKPFIGKFTARMDRVSVAEIRGLASIPDNVDGLVTGSGEGSYRIAGESAFDLTLDVSGSVQNALYGGIPAKEATVDVVIETVAIADDLKLKRLEGNVHVNALASGVAIQQYLDGLEVSETARLFHLQGNADARVDLNIPLATAADISTYVLDVNAESDRVGLAERAVRNVNAVADIADGFINFRKITAVTPDHRVTGVGSPNEPKQGGDVFATGRWPLTQERKARFEIKGTSVSLEWIIGVASQYSDDMDGVLRIIDRQYDGENSSVTGKLSVDATIEVHPDDMQDISKWNVTGSISEGSITIDGRTIEKIVSTFSLIDGVFELTEFSGAVPDGGTINVKGSYPLDARAPAAVNLNLDAFPIELVTEIASDFSEDFAETLRQLKLENTETSSHLSGLLSAKLDLTRIAAAAEHISSWEFSAEVSSPRLVIRSNELTDLRVSISLADQLLQVRQLSLNTPADGNIQASGEWPLDALPGEDAEKVDLDGLDAEDQARGNVDIQWVSLPLQLLSEILGATEIPVTGKTSGNFRATRASNIESGELRWDVDGEISSSNTAIAGNRVQNINLKIATDDNRIYISGLSYGESDLTGNVVAVLTNRAPFRFQAAIDLNEFDLTRIADAATDAPSLDELPELSGVLTMRTDLSGTLQPFDISTSGEALVTRLSVNDVALEDVSAVWKNIGNDFSKSKAIINGLGGQVKLTEVTVGPNHILVEIADIDAERLSRVLDTPIGFSGALSGRASLDSWEDPELIRGNLTLEGASTIVGPVKLGTLSGEADYDGKSFDFVVDGILLDGKFLVKGRGEIPEDISRTTVKAKLELADANLRRLASESRAFAQLRELQGDVDIDFDLELDGPEFVAKGDGKVTLRDAKLRNELIISRGTAELKLDGGLLKVIDLAADVAGGDISGEADIYLDQRRRGKFQVRTRRVSLKRLGAVIRNRELHAKGFLDTRITGTIGRDITGVGQISMQRLSVYDIPGQSLRLPVRFQLDPRNFSGRFEIAQSRVRIFDGSLTAKASVQFGSRLNFSSKASFSNLNSGAILGAFAGGKELDQGRLSGELVVDGNGIRSMNDLRGAFLGSLERSQTLQLPVLDDLTRFLNSGQLSNREFDSENIQLRLANGQVLVEQFGLTSSYASILVTGKVALDQRLDLEVIARIGSINANPLLQTLGASKLKDLPLPTVALIGEIADFVSNRIFYLHVGGTTRSPIFRLKSELILRDEVLRFLVRGTELQQLLEQSSNQQTINR